MDEHALIRAQVRALAQQIDWAEARLGEAKIDPRISEAAKNGFGVLFAQRRNELKNMQRPGSPLQASPYSWKQLRNINLRCGELFQECIGFLGGALIRTGQKERQEEDICELADALLSELNGKLPKTVNWAGVTLLAEANFFTETTGLVRLPFPDYGIWNLPIAVHELGHFVGPRVPDGVGGFPFEAILRKKEQDNSKQEGPAQLSPAALAQQVSHLKELFSDIFAAYALGPAYACSCLLLRFNPQDDAACEDNATHPSQAKRAHAILKTLEQTSRGITGDPYKKIIANLSALWATNLQAAGQLQHLMPDEIGPFEYELRPLYNVVAKFLSTVRYAGWERAAELRAALDSEPAAAAAALQPGDTIADVLNAAWLLRLSQDKENSSQVLRVQARAAALCRQIMEWG